MGSMWLEPEDDRVFPIVEPPQWDAGAVNRTIERYPADSWGSDFQAMVVMIEFMSTNWFNVVQIAPPPRVRGPEMMAELEVLDDYQQTGVRRERLDEIVAQARDFQGYMTAQLGISPRSHPKTYLLLKMSARIGEMVMVALKNRYPKGVRPSQIYPLLFPPVPVPPHSSYPSGHALISKMMAMTAGDIVPVLANSATSLADRIALNREIAGLHFAIDSVRGKEAAAKAFPIFQNLGFYQRNLTLAQAEWA